MPLFLKIFLPLSFIFFSPPLFVKAAPIEEFLTKQTPRYLRFLSKNNKLTFFQKDDGTLLSSRNYSIKEELKGPPGTSYTIEASPSNNRLIIEMDPFYFNNYQQNHGHYLYSLNWEGGRAIPVGEGISPKLHLKDQWLSYYDAITRQLTYRSLISPISFAITLLKGPNPYFIPTTYMISEGEILYTDLNGNGQQALLLLDRNKKAIFPLVVLKEAGVRLEICFNDGKLYIGEFGSSGNIFGSRISKIDLKLTKNFNQLDTIYQSQQKDIGHIVCSSPKNKLYFIQNKNDENLVNTFYTEVAEIDLLTKKVTTLSSLQYVTQIIPMDGRILALFNGKFYLIEENSDGKKESF